MTPIRPSLLAARSASRTVVLVLVGLVAALLVGACSGDATGSGETLVRYERVWPDGRVEEETIGVNGEILMKHGEVLERFTLEAEDVARIEAALAEPIPTGSPEDSPKRTIELADGTLIEAPRPEPDSVTALLESLMDTHRLP